MRKFTGAYTTTTVVEIPGTGWLVTKRYVWHGAGAALHSVVVPDPSRAMRAEDFAEMGERE